MSKITRTDLPNNWVNLLPRLVEIMEDSKCDAGAMSTLNSGDDVKQYDNSLSSRRVCLVLHYILKELSSKRLPIDRRNFTSLTQNLFPVVWKRFCDDTSKIVSHMNQIIREFRDKSQHLDNMSDNPDVTVGMKTGGAVSAMMERWLYLMKQVSRMLLFGTGTSDAGSLEEVAMVVQVCPVLVEALRAFLTLYCTFINENYSTYDNANGEIAKGDNGNFLDKSTQIVNCRHMSNRNDNCDDTVSVLKQWLHKSARKIIKCLTSVLELHPWSVLNSQTILNIGTLLDDFLSGDFNSLDCGHNGNQISIQCMLYFHELLRCGAYKKAIKIAKEKNSSNSDLKNEKNNNFKDQERHIKKKRLGLEAANVLGHCFQIERVHRLVGILVSKFIRLSTYDIEEWDASPEAFYHEQEITNWQDVGRPCAESLLLLLVQELPEIVIPILLQEVTEVESQQLPLDYDGVPTPDVLRMEAAYGAICACSYDLHLKIDFPTWLHNRLLPSARDKRLCMRSIRRRVGMLISKWVPCVPAESRPPVYECLMFLLGDEEDGAVRLAACSALRSLIDDWNFDEQQFTAFIGPTIQLLLSLLSSASEFDTQVQAFSLISLLIERLGDRVSPYINGLVSILPSIWQGADDQSLARMQVLIALHRLVVTLGEDSPSLYPILLPMLMYSIDVTEPESITLSEDGVAVWQSVLRQAPLPDPELLRLVPGFMPLLERGLDHLPEANNILQSYILLFGGSFMQQYSHVITGFLDIVIGNVKEKGMLLTLPLIDMVLTLFPREATTLLQTSLLRLITSSINGTESNLVSSMASSIIGGRLLLLDTQTFVQFFAMADSINKSSNDMQYSVDQNGTLLKFIDLWLERFDCITLYSKRKLTALAMCKLFQFSPQILIPRLAMIINIITSVLFEMYELSCSSPGSAFQEHQPMPSPRGAYSDEYFCSVSRSEYGGANGDDDIGSEGDRRQKWFEHDPTTTQNLIQVARESILTAISSHEGNQIRNALSKVDGHILRDVVRFIPEIQ